MGFGNVVILCHLACSKTSGFFLPGKFSWRNLCNLQHLDFFWLQWMSLRSLFCEIQRFSKGIFTLVQSLFENLLSKDFYEFFQLMYRYPNGIKKRRNLTNTGNYTPKSVVGSWRKFEMSAYMFWGMLCTYDVRGIYNLALGLIFKCNIYVLWPNCKCFASLF